MTEHPAQRLLELALKPDGPARLSVIGLSKNAGKTVTLNHLIRAAAAGGVPLGLVSTGRDGEAEDAVTELPKPRIWAPAGALVATAAAALHAGSGRIATLRALPLSTPFGQVVLGRVEEAGEVLLIGPGSAARVAQVLAAFEGAGARLSLVDGSFDRMAAAAPGVTGRVILAAGAAYSASMGQTVAQIRHILELMDLPPVAPALAPLVEQAVAAGPVSLVESDHAVRRLPVTSGLSQPEAIIAAARGAACLTLAGALGDGLLREALRQQAAHLAVAVADPTHILVERSLWRRWRRAGGQVYVRRPVRLLAVTVNPHSPVGRDYDTRAFFQAVAELAQRPVFDLQAGLSQLS